jgi:protein tyrosine/serine phosphatase
MKRFILWSFLLVSLLTNPALPYAGNGTSASPTAVVLPAGAHPSTRIYGVLPGLDNVGKVAPGICRGAQPAAEGYTTLKKMGIKTVINLRTSVSEKAAVEAAGMHSIEIPMEMSTDHLKPKVDRVVALMADPANQPVFVHCRHGQDRTGIVVAAYRMKVEGWRLADAEAEMQAFGFNDVWVNFKRFIRNYGDQLTLKK